MLKLIALAALLALTPAAAALAQTPAPPIPANPAPTPTEAEISRARAEADRLIADAQASDLFTNVTTGRLPMVRHERSGLVCIFTVGERNNRILVFDQGAGIPRSDDVGCNTSVGDVFLTHYATRYRPAITAETALTDAAAAIKRRFPEARAHDGPTEVTVERPGRQPLPRTLLVHYIAAMDGNDHYTAARVAEHDGWIFKQRVTVRLDRIASGQITSDLEWTWMLEALVDRGQAI